MAGLKLLKKVWQFFYTSLTIIFLKFLFLKKSTDSQYTKDNLQISSNNFASYFLVFANVMHKRCSPKINQFVYKVFYICFDISKINNLKQSFFSINRFNVFSFYNKDHGNRDGKDLEIWIRKILNEKNLNEQIVKIFLFTHPRFLGYVFNPVSFWFCLDADNNLKAILFEVNNTFNQHHCYLVYNQDQTEIGEDQWFTTDKKMYVSPFFKVEGNYRFRVIFKPNKTAVWIDYIVEGQKKLLTSAISYKIKQYNDFNLINAFWQIPLVTFKVIFLIHWQALKLFLKKIKFISNPNKISNKITTNK
ncbi:DUF1365 domain-containing protein [Alphaproteobacteria bacterium]|nr:DUF1365 domain-containing protein [Alphaproteobacteria bacterium]